MSKNDHFFDRRNFIKLGGLGIGAGFLAVNQVACTRGSKKEQPAMQGFEDKGD